MNLKRIIREELIKESGVENYLQSIASMTSGNQKKYYQWILDNLEKVPVVSYRSNEELEEKIDRFVKKMRKFGDFCQKKGMRVWVSLSTLPFSSPIFVHFHRNVKGFQPVRSSTF